MSNAKSCAEWTVEISTRRDLVDMYKLMSEIEAETIHQMTITGHEVSQSTFSLFVRSNRQAIGRLVRRLEKHFLFPGESIVLRGTDGIGHPTKNRHRRMKAFDIFAIPLPSNRFGYGHFLGHIDEMQGDAVRIFDYVSHGEIADVKSVIGQPERFPPVLTLLKVAVSTFGWKQIGMVLTTNTAIQFRDSNAALLVGSGVFHDWRLWTSTEGWIDLGDLPVPLRSIEMRVGWSPGAIADRIVTGRHIYDSCF